MLRIAPMLSHTPATLCDPARLGPELEKVRRQGYALDQEEYIAGIIGVSVPVRDGDGKVVAAVAVQTTNSRLQIDEALAFLPQLKQAAGQLAQTVNW
jgi:DNA-binding IclR family transcriptional regulator